MHELRTCCETVITEKLLYTRDQDPRLQAHLDHSLLCGSDISLYGIGLTLFFLVSKKRKLDCFYWFSGPGSSDGKEPACSTGDPGSIPGLGRSLGEGNSNPLQYSYLENPMDRGDWRATVHGVAKSQLQLMQLILSGSVFNKWPSGCLSRNLPTVALCVFKSQKTKTKTDNCLEHHKFISMGLY